MIEPGQPKEKSVLARELDFGEYTPQLHYWLLKHLKRTSDADDAIQETYLRFIRIPQDVKIHQPINFLIGVAVHVVKEFRRRKQKERGRVTFDTTLANDTAEQQSQLAPEDMAEAMARSQQLERALAKLKPMDRAVLILIKVERMTYEEVAAETGLTHAQVEKYHFRALRELRRLTWDI